MLSRCTILCAVYLNSGRKHRTGCSPFICSLKAKEMSFSVPLKSRGDSHRAVPGQTSHLSCCGAVFCFNCSPLVLKSFVQFECMGCGFVGGLGSFLFPSTPHSLSSFSVSPKESGKILLKCPLKSFPFLQFSCSK